MLKQSENTINTLCNAIMLSSAIVQEIAGNEVANTLNGNPITDAVLNDLIASQINKNFSIYTAQGVLA